MSVLSVKDFFVQRQGDFGADYSARVLEFPVSSATVALAALAVGCEEARIAKTLSFKRGDDPILIVTAGDVKIDNAKYKAQIGVKAKMLNPEEVFLATGHSIGGVCPFALTSPLPVYLDVSLSRFKTVFPACGSSNSAIELTIDELLLLSGACGFIDVCKIPAGQWQ